MYWVEDYAVWKFYVAECCQLMVSNVLSNVEAKKCIQSVGLASYIRIHLVLNKLE